MQKVPNDFFKIPPGSNRKGGIFQDRGIFGSSVEELKCMESMNITLLNEATYI
jgi:hypothetical protein